MNKHLVARTFTMFGCLAVLFWSGCANFIVPERGSIARDDARIALTDEGVEETLWAAKDLQLTFSLTDTGDEVTLAGQLIIDRSIIDSFQVVKSFFLMMNFLDGDGQVLETVDITPVISTYNLNPDKISINTSLVRPPGSSAIAFNYYGVFKGAGDSDMQNAEWSILYFPFD